MVRRGSSSFKRRSAWTRTRGSVRRVSGFVLTGQSDIDRKQVHHRCEVEPDGLKGQRSSIIAVLAGELNPMWELVALLPGREP